MLWKRRSDDKDIRWPGYIDGLYSYGLVLTGDREEAEDLVKKVYDYAMRAMASVRYCSNVLIWLFSILRRF
jgi:DNA-directed RNA polymerase specialized sigma24 family protein